MKLPSVTSSNPYLDFAKMHDLDYGDVLNYVGILDNEERTFWHYKSLELPILARASLIEFRNELRKHYGICSQLTLKVL